MAAWSALKQLTHLGSFSSSSLEPEANEEQKQVTIARALASLQSAEGNRSQVQNDRHCGRQKPVTVRRDNHPSTTVSIYPMQCQDWAYSNFSPEVAMYQMWLHGQTQQQQHSCLLALLAPPPLPNPRILPFIQSFFQPNHGQVFPARDRESGIGGASITVSTTSSPLYSSNSSIPVQIRSTSQVTIQEIQEESQGESDANGDSNSMNVDLLSKTSGLHPFIAHNQCVSSEYQTEPKTKEAKEDKQKNAGSDIGITASDREPNIGNSSFNPMASHSRPSMVQTSCFSSDTSTNQNIQESHQKGSQRDHLEWVTGFGPRTSSPSHFQAQNPLAFYSSQANPRLHQPLKMGSSVGYKGVRASSAMAAPVTIRTAVPVCSARPGAEVLNSRASPVNFMAPAVHVRSVIPVCSAPPAKELSNSSQEAVFTGAKMRTGETRCLGSKLRTG